MSETQKSLIPADIEKHIKRVVWLTWIGLWFERVICAYWAALTLAGCLLAAILLGAFAALPPNLWLTSVMCSLAGLAILLGLGTWAFEKPTKSQARARVDTSVPFQPLQALEDAPEPTAGSDVTAQIWAAHRERTLGAARRLSVVVPHFELRHRDPFGLRLMAITILAMGVMFGSLGADTKRPNVGTQTVNAGPAWEGWITPPGHTGKPTLYLADLSDSFAASQGSDVTVRLYDDSGNMTLNETVTLNDAAAEPNVTEQNVTGPNADTDAAMPQSTFDFTIETAGEIAISGSDGRVWTVALSKDQLPAAVLVGDMIAAAGGEMRQDYLVTDDASVDRAVLKIAIDETAVQRVFGYEKDPEPRPQIEVPLLIPQTGNRESIEGRFAEDFSQHPFAKLPVLVSLQAWDGAGQPSEVALNVGVLPGRQFFDPLAAALIDVRAELLWSRENAKRAGRILRAVNYAPDEVFEHDADLAARLRSVTDMIEGGGTQMSDQAQEEAAALLWELAVELEDGDLAEALARLRRAQQRLAQAMKDGASPEDIERLMQELREASEAYIRQLAEQQGDEAQEQAGGESGMTLTGDQLQEMMDRIQELMEQGRMSEAQRLMDALQEFLENMQVRDGQSSGGNGSENDAAREELEDALRDQQDLSDDTFERLQEQFSEEGAGGEQSSEEEQGSQSGSADSLAQRQQELSDGLNGEESADAAEAMREAQEALSDEDYARALDTQAQALEALRDGIRQLSEAENEGDGGSGTEGDANANTQDPLGRTDGNPKSGQADGGPLNEDDNAYDRAQDLSDDLRRRSAEQGREQRERDFLERLLKSF